MEMALKFFIEDQFLPNILLNEYMSMNSKNNTYKEFLQALRNGYSQKIDVYVVIPRETDKRIEVVGYLNFKTISEIQIDELEEMINLVKSNFQKFISYTEVLEDYFFDKQLDYSLDYDYGGGSILLCGIRDGLFRVFYNP